MVPIGYPFHYSFYLWWIKQDVMFEESDLILKSNQTLRTIRVSAFGKLAFQTIDQCPWSRVATSIIFYTTLPSVTVISIKHNYSHHNNQSSSSSWTSLSSSIIINQHQLSSIIIIIIRNPSSINPLSINPSSINPSSINPSSVNHHHPRSSWSYVSESFRRWTL